MSILFFVSFNDLISWCSSIFSLFNTLMVWTFSAFSLFMCLLFSICLFFSFVSCSMVFFNSALSCSSNVFCFFVFSNSPVVLSCNSTCSFNCCSIVSSLVLASLRACVVCFPADLNCASLSSNSCNRVTTVSFSFFKEDFNALCFAVIVEISVFNVKISVFNCWIRISFFWRSVDNVSTSLWLSAMDLLNVRFSSSKTTICCSNFCCVCKWVSFFSCNVSCCVLCCDFKLIVVAV